MASSMHRWTSESGILRKNRGDEEPMELLVFGYSCKLFRDDERAKSIDQGKHLIPWMGDNSLKIDRYDGRGALGDLRSHEPPPGGFDYRTILTEDEMRIEQTCDEERYRSLYNNDAEEALKHEEEIKRLHQALGSDGAYNQVGFNYDNEKKIEEDSQSPKQSEGSTDDDEPYVPIPELELPENIKLPETQKLNAIIVKTALFISKQGNQMEILIKAKQANNPQFSFLSIDGELQPYYKLVLEAIRSGKYDPEKQPEPEEPEKKDSESEEEDDDDNDTYLHPSLASSLKVEAAPSIPSINYKPSKDCAYSMLVNKITGKPPPVNRVSSPSQPQPQPPQGEVIPPPPMPPYGYYGMPNYAPYPPLPQQYTHGPVLYGANGAPAPPLPVPLPPSTTPIVKPAVIAQTPQKEPTPLVPYGPTPPKPLNRPSFIVPPADVQIIIDKMASYVAKNGRDFETIVKNKGDPRFNFLELSHQYYGYYAHKLVIYEGGANSRVLTDEELLQKQETQEEKQKKLEEMHKKQKRMEEVQKRIKMIQEKKKSDNGSEESTEKQIMPVSFSIKKPKEGDTSVIEKRNALPIEESDEEVTDEKKHTRSKSTSPTTTTNNINNKRSEKELSKRPEKELSKRSEKESSKRSEKEFSKRLEKEHRDSRSSRNPIDTRSSNDFRETKLSKSSKTYNTIKCQDVKQTKDVVSIKESKPHQEKSKIPKDSSVQPITQIVDGDFVDLTNDSAEESKKESPEKQLDDKNKQRLLMVARKKLAAEREKQLQLERRKKASAFLNQIKAKKIDVKSDNEAAKPLPKPSIPKPEPAVVPVVTSADADLEELRQTATSLISKIREVTERARKRSISSSSSSSSSSSNKHKSHKKYDKRKQSLKRHRETNSSSHSHSHKSRKSKKSTSSSKHRSRSRSPHKHHSSRRHKRSKHNDSSEASSS
ncbi:hypothetical protein TKK_0004485 [Trichogramma kaykai]